MEIEIITEKIDVAKLRSFLGKPFPNMVKGVVDVERKLLALGGEMHVDAEQVLLQDGSHQENLWGINIFPDRKANEKLEYNSLINIRPSQNNRSMEVQSAELRAEIKKVIDDMVIV